MKYLAFILTLLILMGILVRVSSDSCRSFDLLFYILELDTNNLLFVRKGYFKASQSLTNLAFALSKWFRLNVGSKETLSNLHRTPQFGLCLGL